ncbi:MAG: hypothetical protein GY842_03560 [bacterium]|nr:hypothetical protein [bacterium]
MIDEHDPHPDLERDEAWLEEVMFAQPTTPMSRVKHAVRIEAGEAWLASRMEAEPVSADLAAVKGAVRGEVEGLLERRSRAVLQIRVWTHRLVGLAAAAAVVFGVGIRGWGPEESAVGSVAVIAGLDDWVEAVAVDTSATVQEYAALLVLAEGLTTLESDLLEDSAASWIGQELDDVDAELDTVLTELG